MNTVEIDKLLKLYAEGFEKVLYEEDKDFLKGMESSNLAGDDINRYKFWEWTQGVGLYGFWKLYLAFGEEKYLSVLESYYKRQIKTGLPSKNVNTVTPMLALSFLAEYKQDSEYLKLCSEWADWIIKDFPRTESGGLQHITSDSVNEQELWDDTLFMTVLFLANMGRILDRQDYMDEAAYQFLIHEKYLADRRTGLWYHGWTFKEKHNFAGAFWCRGNCWITAAIPEFINICDMAGKDGDKSSAVLAAPVRGFLCEALKKQVKSLMRYQEEDGMWHTIIDDASSYKEASGSCGAAYGILKAVHMGIIGEEYKSAAIRLADRIAGLTDSEGVVGQVSYGTPMGRESKEFYKNIPLRPMPYGQALAMLYFLELKEELEDL